MILELEQKQYMAQSVIGSNCMRNLHTCAQCFVQDTCMRGL